VANLKLKSYDALRSVVYQIITNFSEHVSILKVEQKEALIYSETSVIIDRSTGRNVSEYVSFRQYYCKNGKSGMNITLPDVIDTRT
jgi:hypothetical protein